ncbi:MAG: rane-anchored adenylyl cyclase [Mycobacterium sp.]|nr:rane-anchored adenylyl cyclase [Mycobacterium sp.]
MDGIEDRRGALTATGLSCGSCGMELPLNSKFCNDCGAPVTQVSRSAEYKQVTVLFADVVHSMDIAAAVGPERLREIMTELADRCAAVVQGFGGTVDKFTGDGIMAVFGAPVALEDHAVRACLTALGVQEETGRLAVEVHDHDGVELRLRVGLNSGQVIAGEIGSRSFGYTAIGQHVGIAQRMESAAAPGGVMLSESTARLVDGLAVLGRQEIVRIKGSAEPVRAHRLVSLGAHRPGVFPWASTLVGREWELAALTAMVDRSIDGRGSVACVVGAPGIGKSRLVAEIAGVARKHGAQVYSTFGESHTNEVPFLASTRLLRAALGIEELDEEAARARVRSEVPDADPADLILVDDVLGIRNIDIELPDIAPEARRRRLTTWVNAAALARTSPSVYLIEDAHWVDEVSESLLANFLSVVPQTHSLVLITYRPEYHGALSRTPGAQTITLMPLGSVETESLISELVGTHPSVERLADQIADRAAGNPFFAEEIVRDLADRGILIGGPGEYECPQAAVEVVVPATLQAAIGARIDRLAPDAKRVLNAAAVIGSRFNPDLLMSVGIAPALDQLIAAELIDQVMYAPRAEFVFRHPLIRAVAYESQLKSQRAKLHHRLAAAIEDREPGSADENAAIIAEHHEAAGELAAAYAWHMRAAAWSATRDVAAARLSWDRACQVADRLPNDVADSTAMRIGPRTLLCATGWRVHETISGSRFEELRQICTAAGDRASLAIGMAGLTMEHLVHARLREGSRMASEYMSLLESIGDATLTVGLSFAAIVIKRETGELLDMLRWTQNVINLSKGDPTMGNLIIGSPLAAALAWRGEARWCLGQNGWRDDFDGAISMARKTDPISHAVAVYYKYGLAIPSGVLLADDAALSDIEEALSIAERSADDTAVGLVQSALGLALVHRADADRLRGIDVLTELRDLCLHDRYPRVAVPAIDMYTARQMAAQGDHEGALMQVHSALGALFDAGQPGWCAPGTAILVELLIARNDVHGAQAAIDRFATTRVPYSWAAREVWLVRSRALLARAHGDETAYRDYRDRYRAMATSLGFEGHMKWAEAMT